MTVRTLPLLSLVALLAGCTVGPDFKRPAPPGATAYLAPGETAVRT